MSHAQYLKSHNALSGHDVATLPDFSALAQGLQEVAQALLVFSQTCRPVANGAASHVVDDAEGKNAFSEDAESSGSSDRSLGELRCYRLPFYAVREERAMLEKHEAASFVDVLNEVHADLAATALLMRGFDETGRMDGFTVQMIGEHLLRPLDSLSKTCSLFADFNLVRVTPTD